MRKDSPPKLSTTQTVYHPIPPPNRPLHVVCGDTLMLCEVCVGTHESFVKCVWGHMGPKPCKFEVPDRTLHVYTDPPIYSTPQDFKQDIGSNRLSQFDMISFPPQHKAHLVEMTSKFKTIGLIGPCGSGKRTLIKQALESARELPLEHMVIPIFPIIFPIIFPTIFAIIFPTIFPTIFVPM